MSGTVRPPDGVNGVKGAPHIPKTTRENRKGAASIPTKDVRVSGQKAVEGIYGKTNPGASGSSAAINPAKMNGTRYRVAPNDPIGVNPWGLSSLREYDSKPGVLGALPWSSNS